MENQQRTQTLKKKHRHKTKKQKEEEEELRKHTRANMADTQAMEIEKRKKEEVPKMDKIDAIKLLQELYGMSVSEDQIKVPGSVLCLGSTFLDVQNASTSPHMRAMRAAKLSGSTCTFFIGSGFL